MENENFKKNWDKPELFVISSAGLNESVLVVSGGGDDGGNVDPPPWTRP